MPSLSWAPDQRRAQARRARAGPARRACRARPRAARRARLRGGRPRQVRSPMIASVGLMIVTANQEPVAAEIKRGPRHACGEATVVGESWAGCGPADGAASAASLARRRARKLPSVRRRSERKTQTERRRCACACACAGSGSRTPHGFASEGRAADVLGEAVQKLQVNQTQSVQPAPRPVRTAGHRSLFQRAVVFSRKLA
jgi:hypothetical protein